MKDTTIAHPGHGKNLARFALATGLLLLVPLVAMQFTDDVAWTLFDFVVAGTLLFGAGLTFELIAGRMRSTKQRAVTGGTVFVVLAVVWAQLAVGIFD